jgi:hypothetical protein
VRISGESALKRAAQMILDARPPAEAGGNEEQPAEAGFCSIIGAIIEYRLPKLIASRLQPAVLPMPPASAGGERYYHYNSFAAGFSRRFIHCHRVHPVVAGIPMIFSRQPASAGGSSHATGFSRW